MRILILVLVSFVIFSSCDQPKAKSIIITDYSNETHQIEEIDSTEIDIHFLSRNYSLPLEVPMQFRNEEHSNETITKWSNDEKKGDYFNTWSNSYTYNSDSEITNYSYSGCMVCALLPYYYSVTYNSEREVIEIKGLWNNNHRYTFEYNKRGDLLKANIYSGNSTLVKSIKIEH